MSTVREPSAQEMAVRTAGILFIFVIVFTGFLAGAYQWTRPAILASAAAEKMALIGEVLPSERYNNKLLADTIDLPATPEVGSSETTKVYRARKDGVPAALVLEVVAPDGYAGKIQLLLAVGYDGKINGVRVLNHKETPGLGDYIEPRKDKNKRRPWITQFDGRHLSEPAAAGWKVKKDGGEFDANTGATVTPRAIVKAVHKALKFVDTHRDQLFAIRGDKP